MKEERDRALEDHVSKLAGRNRLSVRSKTYFDEWEGADADTNGMMPVVWSVGPGTWSIEAFGTTENVEPLFTVVGVGIGVGLSPFLNPTSAKNHPPNTANVGSGAVIAVGPVNVEGSVTIAGVSPGVGDMGDYRSIKIVASRIA
jgi:hypothetical protein